MRAHTDRRTDGRMLPTSTLSPCFAKATWSIIINIFVRLGSLKTPIMWNTVKSHGQNLDLFTEDTSGLSSQNAMSLTLMLYRWKKFTSIQLPLGKVWIILSTGVEASQSATVARGQNGCHWKVYSLENCIWLAEWKQLKLTFYDRYFVQHTATGTKPYWKGCYI